MQRHAYAFAMHPVTCSQPEFYLATTTIRVPNKSFHIGGEGVLGYFSSAIDDFEIEH